ncbi:unnamed protein product [Meloidogyne enterolobii]|uniref:Uncharacterized protein n=1 Tax=Meloidogyne enterolobii TaxID=390850 RepID=A0ACB1B7A4_MELEN
MYFKKILLPITLPILAIFTVYLPKKVFSQHYIIEHEFDRNVNVPYVKLVKINLDEESEGNSRGRIVGIKKLKIEVEIPENIELGKVHMEARNRYFNPGSFRYHSTIYNPEGKITLKENFMNEFKEGIFIKDNHRVSLERFS